MALSTVPAVVETSVVHDAHRYATSLLADSCQHGVDPGAVMRLRDIVVAALRHHHECEDHDLWPRLVQAAPTLRGPLAALTAEHDRLDIALDQLETSDDPTDATTVRDLVHEHLDNEEPLLLPALRDLLPAAEWDAFSARTVASAPQVGIDLLVGLFYEVAPDEDVAVVLRHLPAEAAAAVPDLRAAAAPTLDELRRAEH